MKNNYLFTCFLMAIFSLLLQLPAFGAEELVLLSLDDAINMALENNLDLKLQKADLAAAQGSRQIQAGPFAGNITAGAFKDNKQLTSLVAGGASEEDLQVWNASLRKKIHAGTEMDLSWENQRYDSNSSLMTFQPAYQSALSLGISQPLLKGRGVKIQTTGIQAAGKSIMAASSQVDSRAVNLAADVKKAYWELNYSRYDIEVKKLSLKLAKQIVTDTRHKIEAGVIASVEIFRPESELARREEGLISTERTRADAEDKLKLLLNRVEWNASLKTEELPAIEETVPQLETVIDYALKNHPDLKAADYQIQAARLDLLKAKDSLLPEISVSGRAGFKGTDNQFNESTDNMINDSDFSWRVGLNFSMPLDNAFAQGNKVISQAKLTKSNLFLAQLRQQLIMQARDVIKLPPS